MVDFKGKLIHTFNKNEDAIHSSDYFEKLCGRTNVILMGDSLGDIKMALGVPQPSKVLKIGFLNVKVSMPASTVALMLLSSQSSSNRRLAFHYYFLFTQILALH